MCIILYYFIKNIVTEKSSCAIIILEKILFCFDNIYLSSKSVLTIKYNVLIVEHLDK